MTNPAATQSINPMTLPAPEAYEHFRREIQAQLQHLAAVMQYQPGANVHWGHVGDLGNIAHQMDGISQSIEHVGLNHPRCK